MRTSINTEEGESVAVLPPSEQSSCPLPLQTRTDRIEVDIPKSIRTHGLEMDVDLVKEIEVWPRQLPINPSTKR